MPDTTFAADLEAVSGDLTNARAALVSTVQRLSDEGLDRARRGGWTVRRVLEHVVEFEWLCVMAVAALRGQPPAQGQQTSCEGQPVDEILCMLDASRHALLQAVDGVDEETFYTLGRLGREEYSVLSALENVAHHDREHVEQINSIVAS